VPRNTKPESKPRTKPPADEILPTDYDRPSEKYPALKELGIPRGKQTILDAALRELIEVRQNAKELHTREEVLMIRIQDIYEGLGFSENDITRCWAGMPFSMRYSTSSKLSVDKLLELGVAASTIEQARVSTQSKNLTVQLIAPRGKKGEDE
jgi:hypothetical protein